MRIYVAGKMTGMPDHNRPAFNAAAKRLREQGHFVINPAELSAIFGEADEVAAAFITSYEGAFSSLARCVMHADLSAVNCCDAIYLLRGWETSRGAKKELAEAIRCGLQVMQEGDLK